MEFPRGVSVNKIDSGKTLPLVHIAHMRNTYTNRHAVRFPTQQSAKQRNGCRHQFIYNRIFSNNFKHYIICLLLINALYYCNCSLRNVTLSVKSAGVDCSNCTISFQNAPIFHFLFPVYFQYGVSRNVVNRTDCVGKRNAIFVVKGYKAKFTMYDEGTMISFLCYTQQYCTRKFIDSVGSY